VLAFDSGRWRRLPSLPSPGKYTVDRTVVGAAAGQLLVFASESYSTAHSGSFRQRVLRLEGDHWMLVAHNDSIPNYVEKTEPIGDQLFESGELCAPTIGCPFSGPELSIMNIRGASGTSLPTPPIEFGSGDVFVAGSAIVAYDSSSRGSTPRGGHRFRYRPGDVAAYDLASRRWLRGPRAPRYFHSVVGETWTPSGLVVIETDHFGSSCRTCEFGGQILRPATR
jgi:hypothetical protein